jgi:hypothetical protein
LLLSQAGQLPPICACASSSSSDKIRPYIDRKGY